MKKWILILLTIIFSVLTTIFGWTSFNRMGMDYNAEGNYFDQNSAIVYHEQAVIVYVTISFTMFIVTLLTIWKLRKIIKKT